MRLRSSWFLLLGVFILSMIQGASGFTWAFLRISVPKIFGVYSWLRSCGRLTIRWNGPGMLRDLPAKLYDVSGLKR
jgi:hypothetical protein